MDGTSAQAEFTQEWSAENKSSIARAVQLSPHWWSVKTFGTEHEVMLGSAVGFWPFISNKLMMSDLYEGLCHNE